MIRDARALRDEFVPQELQHRNSEIDHISSCLRPVEEDIKGEHVLITGPSGAGKTTLAKHVCQHLERQTLGVRTGYVNCLSANNPTGVIHMLLRNSRIGRDFARESTARSQYFERIRSSDEQLVFIVDEDLPDRIKIPQLSKEESTDDQKLEADDARLLIEHYRNSPKDYGTIQHVILEVIWHIGCRTGCIRALDLGDWYPEEQKLTFRHRPPTRPKDGTEHERNVAIPDDIADAIDFYISRERAKKRDENGREPLFSTRFGRPAESTVQTWAYQATQPCIATACPHNRKRAPCEYTEKSHASKCPSSRAPHAIRTGSITWQLNQGLSYVRVAQRVAASPETIRRYYDKADLQDELERRRSETGDLDVLKETDDDAE